jgi:hypothetical protein
VSDTAVAVASAAVTRVPEAHADERVKLGEPQRTGCSAQGPVQGQDNKICDRLPFFEEGLKKAITENFDCAPKTGKEGTLNYVLSIDFTKRSLHIYPGKSGQWRGPQARRAAQCVERALPTAEWDKIPHQYRRYLVAILATYRGPESSPAAPPGPSGAPVFE